MPTLTSLIPKNIIIPDDIYMYITKLYFSKYVLAECVEYVECIRERLDVYRNECDWPSHYDIFRIDLNSMYNAITEENLWSFLAKEDPPNHLGYSFWDQLRMNRISNHPDVIKCEHSGASFHWCFSVMKYIAVNGWNSIFD